MKPAACVVAFILIAASWATAETWPPAIKPLMSVVELNVGDSVDVTLMDGTVANVALLNVRETRDPLRQALREARVTIKVNGEETTLSAGNYRLPIVAGGVQIDCPITKGCVQPKLNPWAIEKDVRLRLWPAGSPWIQPGTFVYPAKQRWFATSTQMANEPTYVDRGEIPARKQIYYHWGLDIGGVEESVDVVSATDAVVVCAGTESVSPPDYPTVVKPRADVVYSARRPRLVLPL